VPKNVTVSLSETNFRKKPSLKRFIFSRFGGNELASLSMKDILLFSSTVVATTGLGNFDIFLQVVIFVFL
jgi:hypothetical protein